ncbi:P-loop containing nucleoside triphosphate hydrolase protein [Blyttiomyces helicus]|uniref:P-loop containing nucleoside triphosphate hydrolase protein n=1 Tax=Blyttiomyces helicus TaxID=388810 RepID=A0A4P9W1J2_9FUNG|nr:P-loop containing nucleoside triphosphate hydrolase protein [Blyttiomyces helicus]|eukprot:RKO85023.1 P-loop containing nucleoside triphosphate hydrolase protein [Blyttiomyces helicus]
MSNPKSNDHVLALHGANGVGKTRLAHGLAEALDLPIKTINLGSINDLSYFTAHGFTFVDSEPGRIVQILSELQIKNCIVYFDELDKIHHTEKGQAIFAYLTHLIDPTQNKKYQDTYLSGLELDMSSIFFIFSFNDENMIDKTVKDRLKIIKIKEPSFKDKILISEKFIIPEISKNVNYNVPIPRSVVERVVQQDKTFSGMCGIKRVIEDIISKLNVIRMLDASGRQKISFYNESISNTIDNIINAHEEPEMFSSSLYC